MPMMPAVPRNTVFVLMLAVPTFDMLAVPGRRYENNEVRANAGTVEGKLTSCPPGARCPPAPSPPSLQTLRIIKHSMNIQEYLIIINVCKRASALFSVYTMFIDHHEFLTSPKFRAPEKKDS